MGNCAGIIAPIITGIVIDLTGQYYWAFNIAAALAMAGILGWTLMIGNVAPLNWETRAQGPDSLSVDRA